MKLQLLKLLPKRYVTLLLGHLADQKISPAFLQTAIRLYCKYYKVNMNEAESGIESFSSFNEFFTRELRRELRPIDASPSVFVSPVDGTVAECGAIEDNLLLQAKGIYYSLSDLIGKKKSENYQEGTFLALYLSPRDYHRIHSPCGGKIEEIAYFSGDFWPVNELGVKNIGGLFALNERVVSYLKTEDSFELSMVMVGALIVGKIRLSFTDFNQRGYKGKAMNKKLQEPYAVKKGGEIGRFELGGSTVILLFPKNRIKLSPNIRKGASVKLGEKIGEKIISVL